MAIYAKEKQANIFTTFLFIFHQLAFSTKVEQEAGEMKIKELRFGMSQEQ